MEFQTIAMSKMNGFTDDKNKDGKDYNNDNVDVDSLICNEEFVPMTSLEKTQLRKQKREAITNRLYSGILETIGMYFRPISTVHPSLNGVSNS